MVWLGTFCTVCTQAMTDIPGSSIPKSVTSSTKDIDDSTGAQHLKSLVFCWHLKLLVFSIYPIGYQNPRKAIWRRYQQNCSFEDQLIVQLDDSQLLQKLKEGSIRNYNYRNRSLDNMRLALPFTTLSLGRIPTYLHH